ncbi:hypothetical protein K466DRAFT_328958 [Polyporus arcularius HHB13444]|uniref:Uncharacterized protein n=1 Tax=Polyporus arcularius HHB13444 TaxID=1314778 RepID=A0A5C3NXA6_9APHY|nr:hypothetical protein K466DRAFT_328958 [Polyporus arcularius HHB13444]
MFADAFGQYDYGSTSRLARGLVLFDSRRSRPLALRRGVSHEYTGYSRWSVMRPLQNTVLLAISIASFRTRRMKSHYHVYVLQACISTQTTPRNAASHCGTRSRYTTRLRRSAGKFSDCIRGLRVPRQCAQHAISPRLWSYHGQANLAVFHDFGHEAATTLIPSDHTEPRTDVS